MSEEKENEAKAGAEQAKGKIGGMFGKMKEKVEEMGEKVEDEAKKA